jgi:hypothetical protein
VVTAAPLRAWPHPEARAHLILEWLAELGGIDEDGKPRPAVALQLELEREARRLRGELGLSPLALAKTLGALTPLVGSQRLPSLAVALTLAPRVTNSERRTRRTRCERPDSPRWCASAHHMTPHSLDVVDRKAMCGVAGGLETTVRRVVGIDTVSRIVHTLFH